MKHKRRFVEDNMIEEIETSEKVADELELIRKTLQKMLKCMEK